MRSALKAFLLAILAFVPERWAAHDGKLAHMPKRYLAACVLLRDPWPGDLREWVEYHLWAGVDFIFLYDHNSSAPLWHEVADYALEGRVQYTRYTSQNVRMSSFAEGLQGRVFHTCIAQARGYFTWLMLTDHDEYMLVTDPQYNHSLPALLRKYERTAGAVLANWRVIGSGGIERRSPGQGFLDTFTKCVPEPNQHVKAIIHLDYAAVGFTPHSFFYSDGRGAIRPGDSNATTLLVGHTPWVNPPVESPLVIYHYQGARQEYQERIPRMKTGASGFTEKKVSQYLTLDKRSKADCLEGKRAYARMPRRPWPGCTTINNSGYPAVAAILAAARRLRGSS